MSCPTCDIDQRQYSSPGLVSIFDSLPVLNVLPVTPVVPLKTFVVMLGVLPNSLSGRTSAIAPPQGISAPVWSGDKGDEPPWRFMFSDGHCQRLSIS